MLSDRGLQFSAKVFRELGRLLRIKLVMSMAYHPQTDGKTERLNQELEIYVRLFCQKNPATWKDLMPTAEFAHNQRTHSTTRQSPFFLMMGYKPQAIPTAFPKTNVPSVKQRILNLQKAREEAIAAHDLARQKMAERTTRGFTPFKKGNKVWLEGTNL
jgi:transposase InsO family protein